MLNITKNKISIINEIVLLTKIIINKEELDVSIRKIYVL